MYVRQQNVSKTESSVRIVFMLIVGNIQMNTTGTKEERRGSNCSLLF